MKSFNTIVSLLTISTLLAGCDTKRNPYFGDDKAQFKISAVSVESTQALASNSFGEVNNVRYDLKACIQDLSGASLPARQKFDVIVGKEGISRTTNKEGCIVWQREIGFDPYAAEKYYLLTTTIVGRGEVQGQLSVDIALNPWTKEVRDLSVDRDAAPNAKDMERVNPSADSFKLQDITNSGTGTARPQTPPPAGETGLDSVLPRSNVVTNTNLDSYPLQMAISSVSLKKLRLHPDTPYTINKHLELTTHEVHEFGASVKFFTKRFDYPETEVTPKAGRFKVTIALLDEPNYDTDDMWKEVEGLETVKPLLGNGSNSKWSADLRFAATGMIAAKRINENTVLSSDAKRRLMAKALTRYLQQTHQFETEMKPKYGISDKVKLSFTKLAHLKNRALLAYTIQPISPDIRAVIKADGVGHATTGLHGGWGILHAMKVEADLIYNELKHTQSLEQDIDPLQNYLAVNKATRKNLAVRMLNTDPIAKNSNVVSLFKDYDFKDALQKYFTKSLSYYEKKKFMVALCYKVFMRDEFASLESKPTSTAQRSLQAFNCSAFPETWFDVTELEFVQKAPAANVKKVGRTEQKTISIAKNLSLTAEHGLVRGTSLNAKAGASFDLSTPGEIPGANGAPGVKLPVGLNLSVGNDWYYTESVTRGKSESAQTSITSSISINVEQSQFQFETAVRKCVQIGFTKQARHSFTWNSKIKTVPDGFLACDDKVQNVTRIEDYYIINQACDDSARTADCSSDEDNKIRMIIRGKPVYDFFNSLVLKPEFSLLLKKIPQEAVRDQLASWNKQFSAFYTSQFFPGVLVQSQALPLPERYTESKK